MTPNTQREALAVLAEVWSMRVKNNHVMVDLQLSDSEPRTKRLYWRSTPINLHRLGVQLHGLR